MKKNIFFERMQTFIGKDETEALKDALSRFIPKAVRYNSVLGKADNEEKVPWYPTFGRYWAKQQKPAATLDYFCGKYYIQEASAMAAVAAIIPFLKGKSVLDLCASPGGKATFAAEYAEVVVANEVIFGRTDALKWNLVRHRLANTLVTCLNPEELAKNLPHHFDVVIVDAPCSGEGLIAKGKNSLSAWNLKNVEFCARRQRSILKNASDMLKDNGILLYSTCTFAPEENEDNVAFLLNELQYAPVALPEIKGLSSALTADTQVALCSRRIWPHKVQGAGAFFAVLQNTVTRSEKQQRSVKPTNFSDELLKTEKAFFYEKNACFSAADFSNIPQYLYEKAMQIGLPVKFIDKERGYFHGACSFARDTYALSTELALRFTQGEDLKLPLANGFYFFSHENTVLGLAKVTNGRAVNKLPKPMYMK